MSSFISIKTFQLPHEAAIPMGRLESEGIDCILQDSSRGSFNINMSGGVSLMVHEKNVEQATRLLLEWDYLKPEDIKVEKPLTIKKSKQWILYVLLVIIIGIILYQLREFQL